MANILTPPPGDVSAAQGASDPTLVSVQDPSSIARIGLAYSTGAGAGSAPPGGEHQGAHDTSQPNQYPATEPISGVTLGETGMPGSQGIDAGTAPAGAAAMQVTNPNNFAGNAGGGSGTQMIGVSDAISGPDDWTATQDNYPPGRPLLPGNFYPAMTGAGEGSVMVGGWKKGQRG